MWPTTCSILVYCLVKSPFEGEPSPGGDKGAGVVAGDMWPFPKSISGGGGGGFRETAGLRGCAGAFLGPRLSIGEGILNPRSIKLALLCGRGGDGVVPFLVLWELGCLLNIDEGSSELMIEGGVTVRAIGAIIGGCCGCGC